SAPPTENQVFKYTSLREHFSSKPPHDHCLFSYLFIYLFIYLFETGSYCIALAHLKLIMYTTLASNSQRSICLCLPSDRIKGVYHHAWPDRIVLNCMFILLC
ncbi:mCG144799, partial [Mus musculus]